MSKRYAVELTHLELTVLVRIIHRTTLDEGFGGIDDTQSVRAFHRAANKIEEAWSASTPANRAES